MPPWKSDPVWKYFKKLNDTEVKCNQCTSDNIIKREFSVVKDHLIELHYTHIKEDVEKWENDTYPLWRHFSREDWYIARCNIPLCGALVKSANRQVIERHLNRWHKTEVAAIQKEITHTWSRHFTFEDSYAICKLQDLPLICRNKAKMYQIDLLKSHLETFYNINKYSRCEERTGDNNADEIIQQSVDETNYAGPSSHDNTHPQSLGNQEDGRIIQQPVDERNYTGSSSHHDNTHPQSFENRENQQK